MQRQARVLASTAIHAALVYLHLCTQRTRFIEGAAHTCTIYHYWRVSIVIIIVLNYMQRAEWKRIQVQYALVYGIFCISFLFSPETKHTNDTMIYAVAIARWFCCCCCCINHDSSHWPYYYCLNIYTSYFPNIYRERVWLVCVSRPHGAMYAITSPSFAQGVKYKNIHNSLRCDCHSRTEIIIKLWILISPRHRHVSSCSKTFRWCCIDNVSCVRVVSTQLQKFTYVLHILCSTLLFQTNTQIFGVLENVCYDQEGRALLMWKTITQFTL